MGSIVLLKVKLFVYFFVFRLIFLLKVNKEKKKDNADFFSGICIDFRYFFITDPIFGLVYFFTLIHILHDFIFHLIGKKLVVWIIVYTCFPQHFLFTFYQRGKIRGSH